ncbi:DNA polymerase IV (plasmid) [Deinococcus aetherius]|uniref:DNA polymerase IV n=1 Tax=Deinococcus aetherius TaxID=200252 RepID=A0ABN6RL80_9DEIO|nr:DNA polymerase IV [Deinococcus aetherius]BDP44087.1 DNA polymerase IV [Deinococcus aetherius]
MTRLIVHVDMDAFYASIEVRDRPELTEEPVAVIATARKGAVMTANYVARKYGVRSAMPVHFALRRCPGLVLIPQRMEVYRAVSVRIHEVFARYTDVIEPLALDEAYLDVTREGRTLADAEEKAHLIQADILAETGLTCSAGVAENKFLAKLASGMHKPAGLTVIRPGEVDALLAALPVEEFHGVGPVIAGKLRAGGIGTGAELRARSLPDLQALLGGGKLAPRLYDLARGVDERPVEAHREAQSIGVEHTFDEDRTTRGALLAELPVVTAEVAARLSKRGYVGRTVVLKLRYEDWTPVTRRRTVDRHLGEAGEIAEVAASLLTPDLLAGQGVRLLGVSVINLVRRGEAEARGGAPLRFPPPT